MDYIASLSYGKDSMAMLEVIRQRGLPLDRILHIEIMATKTIPADLPEMMEFKDYADKIIKKRYGISVERIKPIKSYEEVFYGKFISGKKIGQIYGFPIRMRPWCNSRLKTSTFKKATKRCVTYVGIAIDEPFRFKVLNDKKKSPLVEFGITEAQCLEICKELRLLAPIYKHTNRGGCWFCHNQKRKELRYLRANYPEHWQLLLNWDKDSPTSFKQDFTVADLEQSFQREDRQMEIFGRGSS